MTDARRIRALGRTVSREADRLTFVEKVTALLAASVLKTRPAKEIEDELAALLASASTTSGAAGVHDAGSAPAAFARGDPIVGFAQPGGPGRLLDRVED